MQDFPFHTLWVLELDAPIFGSLSIIPSSRSGMYAFLLLFLFKSSLYFLDFSITVILYFLSQLFAAWLTAKLSQ